MLKKITAFAAIIAAMLCACVLFSGAADVTEETTVREIVLPSKVTGLKQKSAASDSVTFTWSKVEGADGYIIYRYYSADKKYSEIARTGKNTFTLSSLPSGGKCTLKVGAYNADGIGTKSDTLTAYTAPAKVTSLKNSAATTTTVTLTWKKVSGATGYRVYKYNTSTKKYALYKSVTANTVKVTSLKAKTNYKFYVTATRKAGGATYVGAKSGVLLTGTSTAAPAVSSVSGSGVTSAKISFKAVSRATGYYAQVSTSKKFTSPVSKSGTKSPLTVTGLTPGKTYYVRLRTYRTVNGVKVYSPYSTVKSFKLAVKGIDILQSSKKTYTGCKAYLTSKIYPSSVTLKWATSDKKIATVKANGKTGCIVTAKKAGTVTVTASFVYKNKTYKDTCKITVVDPKKVPGYAACPDVPDFGAVFGVEGISEGGDGMIAYAYMKDDVKKKVTNIAEVDNYRVLLEKRGFEDWTWIVAEVAADAIGDEMKIIGCFMNERYMVILSEETQQGIYAVAAMDLSAMSQE